MRYAQRAGCAPAEQRRRARLRMKTAGRFARGDRIGEIARPADHRMGGTGPASRKGEPRAEAAEGPHLGRRTARAPWWRVSGAGGCRACISGVVCYRTGDRPYLFCHLLVYPAPITKARPRVLADRIPVSDHRHPPSAVGPMALP